MRWDGAQEQTVTGLTVDGYADPAAWIMPVPQRATVRLGDPEPFDQLAGAAPPSTAPPGSPPVILAHSPYAPLHTWCERPYGAGPDSVRAATRIAPFAEAGPLGTDYRLPDKRRADVG